MDILCYFHVEGEKDKNVIVVVPTHSLPLSLLFIDFFLIDFFLFSVPPLHLRHASSRCAVHVLRTSGIRACLLPSALFTVFLFLCDSDGGYHLFYYDMSIHCSCFIKMLVGLWA